MKNAFEVIYLSRDLNLSATDETICDSFRQYIVTVEVIIYIVLKAFTLFYNKKIIRRQIADKEGEKKKHYTQFSN